MLLKGKTAVITGCNRGIGKAVLEVFAENGADIFACVRKERPEFSEEIQRLASKYQVEIIPLYFDLIDGEAMKSAIGTIRKSKKPIDILVCNAGVLAENALFQMTTLDNIRKLFDVNFFAQMQFTQYISRLMLRNKTGGSIVFMSSIAVNYGVPGQVSYAAAKSALEGATRSLAREFGANNIRVNVVAPGLVSTDMGNQTDADSARVMIENSALGRWTKPEEIANVILFLASELSNCITGQILHADGGIF